MTIADRTWDHLPAEIHSRIMAATAHARIRRVEHHVSSDPPMPQGLWTVDAVAGDRFVHQVLGLREDGSVFEETRTCLLTDVTDVSVDGGGATVTVPGPSGPESIAVSDSIGAALSRTEDRRPPALSD
jgi:hypothetical protein